MAEQYTREKLWSLYKNISEELKDALWSEDGADAIYEACARNDVSAEDSRKVQRQSSYVMLGLTPPEEFAAALEKEVGLKKPVAKKVAQEIFRTVFFPVRIFLSELYHTALGSSEAPSAPPAPLSGAPASSAGPTPASVSAGPQSPLSGPKSDTYREPIE